MKTKLLSLFLFFFLISALPQEKEEVKLVGSKIRTKYHLSTCEWAKKIWKENLIEFKSTEQADSAGYKPCRVCKPNKGYGTDYGKNYGK
jgi:methylphosphotriester-DNA--protein-cysteine methyltransferase